MKKNKKNKKISAEPIQWIEWLSVQHSESEARRQLMDLNKLAIPYLKKGLSHSNDQVRVGCCRVLDYLYDESCLLDLMKIFITLIPKYACGLFMHLLVSVVNLLNVDLKNIKSFPT